MSPPSQRPYRKFDSAVQKTRAPIEDPVKFNQLMQEYAQSIGTFMMDLQKKKKRNEAAANRALEIAEKLTEMEPQRGVPWSCKCQALYSLGRLSEAIEANKRALEIDPSDPDKWLLQGNMLNALGKTKDAEVAFKRAKELA